jgi:xanthine/CO dehydrogenase XdhC/CoxF family maturation factor
MDDDANSLGVGLGCNGIIDVLIEPVNPHDPHNPVALLREFVQRRDVRVMATVLKSSAADLLPGQRFVRTEENAGDVPAWLAEDMHEVLLTGKPATRTFPLPAGPVDVFLERIDPGIELVIFGAGYDVIPLARLAREIGWQVTVTEDCIAHLAPKRFPAATCVLYADRHAVLDKITITDRTAAVLMSHNFKYDLAVLADLLTTPVPYIGILGPRKRFEKMLTEYEKAGKHFPESALQRVHAPVGLDLGAETPDEIALAVVAEVKAFFSRRAGGFLKDKTGPIHERADAARTAIGAEDLEG